MEMYKCAHTRSKSASGDTPYIDDRKSKYLRQQVLDRTCLCIREILKMCMHHKMYSKLMNIYIAFLLFIFFRKHNLKPLPMTFLPDISNIHSVSQNFIMYIHTRATR